MGYGEQCMKGSEGESDKTEREDDEHGTNVGGEVGSSASLSLLAVPWVL